MANSCRMQEANRFLSPPQLARRLGVGETKVLGWIKSGALRAVNLASNVLGRPRYRVSPEALAEFLAGRVAEPPEAPARQSRSCRPTGWVERY
jgi:excisionase family DNA binding protein